jgi:putative acetyltransferase
MSTSLSTPSPGYEAISREISRLLARLVRRATPDDFPAIDAIHRSAFPTDVEARLVALLIGRGKATISLVAEIDGQVVGHILFSPAMLHRKPLRGPLAPRAVGLRDDDDPSDSANSQTLPLAEQADHIGLGLAPLAVLPPFQNQGIGTALVRAGLAECHRIVVPWVVVLGHETYYPRFGFAPARRWNLTGDYGSSDAFQFLPLTAAADSLRGGHIRYAPEFAEIFGLGR